MLSQCTRGMQKLVEDFAWTSLYKHMYIAENVENKLWNTYSLPYTHAKKPIFKPMTGSVSKWKGIKRFSKRNMNEKTKDSTAVASGLINLRNVDNVMKLHHDSDDLD